MAAKDYSFISSKNQNLSFNENSNYGLYNNLNLNNTFNRSSKDVTVISKSSIIHNNCYQLPTNDHFNQQSNRSSDFKDFSRSPRPIFDIKDRGKKDYSKQNFVGSNSTLMIHITAAEQNGCLQNLESVNNISTGKHQVKNMKKWKSAKECLNSSKSINHAFEFPRQQENEAHTTPEVMQFKSSQRLRNVNERWLGELGITRKKNVSILYYEIDGQICHVFLLDKRRQRPEDAEKKFYCRTCESIDRKRRIWKVVNGVQFIDNPTLNHHDQCNGIGILQKRHEQLKNSFDKKIADGGITATDADDLFQQFQEHMGLSFDQNLTDAQKKKLKDRLFHAYSDSQSSKALTNDLVDGASVRGEDATAMSSVSEAHAVEDGASNRGEDATAMSSVSEAHAVEDEASNRGEDATSRSSVSEEDSTSKSAVSEEDRTSRSSISEEDGTTNSSDMDGQDFDDHPASPASHPHHEETHFPARPKVYYRKIDDIPSEHDSEAQSDLSADDYDDESSVGDDLKPCAEANYPEMAPDEKISMTAAQMIEFGSYPDILQRDFGKYWAEVKALKSKRKEMLRKLFEQLNKERKFTCAQCLEINILIEIIENRLNMYVPVAGKIKARFVHGNKDIIMKRGFKYERYPGTNVFNCHHIIPGIFECRCNSSLELDEYDCLTPDSFILHSHPMIQYDAVDPNHDDDDAIPPRPKKVELPRVEEQKEGNKNYSKMMKLLKAVNDEIQAWEVRALRCFKNGQNFAALLDQMDSFDVSIFDDTFKLLIQIAVSETRYLMERIYIDRSPEDAQA